jgi:hypothetical protein
VYREKEKCRNEGYDPPHIKLAIQGLSNVRVSRGSVNMQGSTIDITGKGGFEVVKGSIVRLGSAFGMSKKRRKGVSREGGASEWWIRSSTHKTRDTRFEQRPRLARQCPHAG